MKYLAMLFLIGTFVAAIAAAPSHSAASQGRRLMKRSTEAATAKAVLQALLKAERQGVFEQDDDDDDDDDDGLEQDEDDGDLEAAIESSSEKAKAQIIRKLIKHFLG